MMQLLVWGARETEKNERLGKADFAYISFEQWPKFVREREATRKPCLAEFGGTDILRPRDKRHPLSIRHERGQPISQLFFL